MKALCARWEKAHEDERKVADSVTVDSRIVQTADAIVFSAPSVIEGTVDGVPGIAQDAADDPEPETEPEEPEEERDPEEPETEETEPDGRTEDAFDRELAVARARIVANAMRIILNG